MGWQGHRGQQKVVIDIVKRAGLSNQDYLHLGHPDTFFRDGVRREVKGRSDRLTSVQRTQLQWMTEVHQPWEILQETHNGVVLRLRTLQAYDLYHAYKTIPCDWTKRVIPLGSVHAQRATRGILELQTTCSKCGKLLWNTISRLRNLGIENMLCKHCSSLGELNNRWKNKR